MKRLRALFVLSICLLVLAVVGVVGFSDVRDEQEQTRGVTYAAGEPGRPPAALGLNAALEQYSDADLDRALQMIHDSGSQWVRQHFYWNDIEPQPGVFRWDTADRIVARVSAHGLHLLAVLDTSPAWARAPGDQDVTTAPPAHVEDYARFVSEFVRRYGEQIQYVQIWDNPNIHPFWGKRVANPLEYTALLRAAAVAARSADPNIRIVSAGLAPNGEKIRGHPDYSDILFLREMYDAGARDYFDVLGAKPYGMWSGPEDRRVSPDVFNFSRVLLLRDEMLAHGDAAKPVWAVEFGWNALPAGWEGAASPWGTDREQVQSDRLAGAIRRAKSEWPWMTVLLAQDFQPNAPASDPLWGFAFVDRNWQPRLFYRTLASASDEPVQPATFDFVRWYMTLGALALVALGAVWRGTVAAFEIPWGAAWEALETLFARLPDRAQFAFLALGVIAFYYSPNTALNLALLVPIFLLSALRLDYALAITIFTIPFYLLPKNLVGTMQFSLVEILTLVSVAAWALRTGMRWEARDSRHPAKNAGSLLRSEKAEGSRQIANLAIPAGVAGSSDPSGKAEGRRQRAKGSERFRGHAGPWEWAQSAIAAIHEMAANLKSVDWAVVFFVLVGAMSVKFAANFGVANREWRVIVIEPALLYALVRGGGLNARGLRRLVDALILSGVAVACIGLYQYFLTDYVIVGEGVRRVLAVYGSPNNLALYFDRTLPLAIALALPLGVRMSRRRRVLYTLAALPMGICLYLTWSRGAWLLGLPAGLLVIALLSGRRVRLAVAALVVVAIIVLVPFLRTERGQSLFQQGTGTGFFRVSVWKSGLAMIRDYPLTGVGLDNFLYKYPEYMQPDAWREPNLSHPHNIILDFWVRLGILGLVALVWIVGEFYRRGLRVFSSHRDDPGRSYARALAVGLMASMTAALAHGMIDAAYFYVDLAFVFMLELALVVNLDRADAASGGLQVPASGFEEVDL